MISSQESWATVRRRRRQSRAWLLVAVSAVQAPLLLFAALELRSPVAVAAAVALTAAQLRWGTVRGPLR